MINLVLSKEDAEVWLRLPDDRRSRWVIKHAVYRDDFGREYTRAQYDAQQSGLTEQRLAMERRASEWRAKVDVEREASRRASEIRAALARVDSPPAPVARIAVDTEQARVDRLIASLRSEALSEEERRSRVAAARVARSARLDPIPREGLEALLSLADDLLAARVHGRGSDRRNDSNHYWARRFYMEIADEIFAHPDLARGMSELLAWAPASDPLPAKPRRPLRDNDPDWLDRDANDDPIGFYITATP